MKKCKNFQKNKLEFIKILTNMILKETSINNLKIIEHDPIKDQRGFFSEILKTKSEGQFSISSTIPGITRGDHFHTRKIERFIVIQGKALVELSKIDSNKKFSRTPHPTLVSTG